MHRFFSALSRTVVRQRYLVVLIWLLGAVAATHFLPSLASQVNNENTQFLPASAPSARAATLLGAIAGNSTTDTQIEIVANADHQLTPADVHALDAEMARARRLATVDQVQWVESAPDGRAAVLLVTSRIGSSAVARQKTLVDELHAGFSRIHAPPGLALHLAGPVATNIANQGNSASAGGKAEYLSFALIIVVLFAVFRSLLAPVLTLAPAGMALLVSMRLIGALGASGLKISELTELLLIVLLLGAGTDYGLFLVYRVREEIRHGLAPRDAVVHALERVGESISASAGTVIVALLSLVFASFGVYKDLAVPLAVGVAVILLAGLTLLPALLAIAGKALFWPARVRAGDAHEGLWGRLVHRLLERPGVTLLAGVALFGALAAGLVGFRSAGFGGAVSAPAGTNVAAGNAVLASEFPQASENPANLVFVFRRPVYTHPAELVTIDRVLRRSDAFTKLAGPLNGTRTVLSPSQFATLHARLGSPGSLGPTPPRGVTLAAYNAYRSSVEYLGPTGRTIQFAATLRAGSQSSTAALQATPRIREIVAAAAHAAGATQNGVTGEAAALYDISATSNSDLLHIIPIAVLAIAILLALVLRSLVAELYLIVSVALSYLAALGLSTIIFVDIFHDGGLTFILPFLMFLFLLALGEDYNILVMTRIREEAHDRPLREAVVRAVGRTGPTVTSAGVVLAGTFGVLVLAAGTGPGAAQIRNIGVGLALGILMDTFLVRTLLVPSTVALLGRWNWWPSRLHLDQVPADPPSPERPHIELEGAGNGC